MSHVILAVRKGCQFCASFHVLNGTFTGYLYSVIRAVIGNAKTMSQTYINPMAFIAAAIGSE